jgi:hypothetical protein
MTAREPAPDRSIYQIRVTLRDSRPPIWRRLELSGATSLEKLHRVLQIAFGWTNSHLHQFKVDDDSYSLPEFELDEYGDEIKNERRAKLGQLSFRTNSSFVYHYDFGDNWIHDIVVEKVFEKKSRVVYPWCTAGERAGPPDDSGGVRGYERLQKAIKDPKDEDHERLKVWVGRGFDPEYFNLADINSRLERIK